MKLESVNEGKYINSTPKILFDVLREWPELVDLHIKLRSGGVESIGDADKQVLMEVAEACGWDEKDVAEEIANMDLHPSERVYRYREIFSNYYELAKRFAEAGNTTQAAEKLWGAALALIKLYAAAKGIFVAHWSMGKVEKFITSNIGKEHKKLFRDLIDKAHILHEHFYEKHLDFQSFKERWDEAIELLEKVKNIIFEELKIS